MAKVKLVLTEEGKKFDSVPLKGKRIPLGEQTEEALLDFAIIARQANRKDYIGLFDNLPSLEDLQSARADSKLDSIGGDVTTTTKSTPAPAATSAVELQGEKNPAQANITAAPPVEEKGKKAPKKTEQ